MYQVKGEVKDEKTEEIERNGAAFDALCDPAGDYGYFCYGVCNRHHEKYGARCHDGRA